MNNITTRPGLVGAIFDPADYIPQPMPAWQEPGSSERQRTKFEALCGTLTLMALTWPIALIVWPIIWKD